MARVRATQYRVVIQFADQFGHRLESEKGLWNQMMLPVVEADCPKCPEPEPVECGSSWHRMSLDDLQNSSINFCPQCGKRLREG